MHKFIAIILATLITACSSVTNTEQPIQISSEIDQQQLLKMQTANEDFLLLDVRSREEFDEGHIPGSVNISHQELADKLDQVSQFKDKNIVVYCRSGRRAGIAIDILKENNFQHTSHLVGDMQGWKKSNLEITKNVGK
ncbi:rhodanese-like domain-containing protein [Thalassotalea nanhaiensis]|uniref:Rhodanese-like domain-containing protein n=1 Tax=Thalassotalea nanhaiensis TaxID=3065648 RepID=A0ABY9TND2_9GAMM|nr:rhodanese-like domain-containing protein [Colwelliaceae bacterium SQ345]